TENVTAYIAWMHAFRNSIEGPILQIPHSSIRLDGQVDSLWTGVNITFGALKRKRPAGSFNSESGDIGPPPAWNDPSSARPAPWSDPNSPSPSGSAPFATSALPGAAGGPEAGPSRTDIGARPPLPSAQSAAAAASLR